MALSKEVLRDLIVAEFENQGFVTDNEHSKTMQFAEAIATAVVTHIASAAEVAVTSGSSAGAYKVS